ncbi:phenylacetate--CoA ligase family protein [Chelativorans sp. M5D2P16]|uniref:phenylacetate--CoA ligase family protein n=1 Tax=Chelativorans sp. M5D2P16 TaxID=3095678 RepID=UPI002ACAD072|nr:AMP-binding protein [Chelativorans sp. M5D2P16]MDZ5697479.1 AMP-binding protein [Chelativorans sp. M5D2P16]
MMRDPVAETLDWDEQQALDDGAYRAQIAYLFENAPFYREKLTAAGFADAASVGGLDAISALPFTTKDALRKSRTAENAIGGHLAVPREQIVRIYSTSGTTGTPSYIPLTATDVADWVEISSRSYSASGIGRGDRLVSTYNAGPFVAGVTLDAFAALGLAHIPVGAGNTERLMAAVELLAPDALACTPSYALYLAEWGEARGIDLKGSSVKRILVAGEPGGGEPTLRARIEDAWGAKVTEAMGIGDVSVSLWGECEAQDGMHFSGRGYAHFELIDPDTGDVLPIEDGAEGELVYTHLRHRAAPILRFRSRDHVVIRTGTCSCGRTAPRVRCIGRTDDMLIVRGVNVFPTAVREVVSEFAPNVTGVISIRPVQPGVKQEPPLPIRVELSDGVAGEDVLAERIRQRIRDKLIFTSAVELVPFGTLPRTDYKSKLVDRSA